MANMVDNQYISKKRPFWVWLITIYYLYSAMVGLYIFKEVVIVGIKPIPMELHIFMSKWTAWDHVLAILLYLIIIAGAGLIFFLRREAFYFFAIQLVIWPVLERFSASAYLKDILLVFVLLYIKALDNRGKLKGAAIWWPVTEKQERWVLAFLGVVVIGLWYQPVTTFFAQKAAFNSKNYTIRSNIKPVKNPGYATYFDIDGIKIEGEMKDGKFIDIVTKTDANGKKNTLRHPDFHIGSGQGELICENGEKIKGEFKNGLFFSEDKCFSDEINSPLVNWQDHSRTVLDALENSTAVVIGTLKEIEPLPPPLRIDKSTENYNYKRYTATIQVVEVLSGTSKDSIRVIMEQPILHGKGFSSVRNPFKIGDFGIWILKSTFPNEHDGEYSLENDNFIAPENKKDLLAMIQRIENRVWSAPQNGLRAWAGKASLHSPAFNLVLENVSDKDVILSHGIVKAFAINEENVLIAVKKWKFYSEFYSEDGGSNMGNDHLTIITMDKKLSIPPTMATVGNYYRDSSFFIIWGKEGGLPAGKYKIYMTFENYSPFNYYSEKDVWQGKLEPPAFDMVVGESTGGK